MNWITSLYVLLIVLVYVPMVFLGANVFFPKYTGSDTYYQGFDDCYRKHPYPTEADKLSETQRQALEEQQQQCAKEQKAQQDHFEQEKQAYEGQKYVLITLFNLAILLLALFLPSPKEKTEKTPKASPQEAPPQQESIVLGLFAGSIAATFGATIRYFDTNSKLGFVILVIIFLGMLYFIYKRKETFTRR
ncbi:MAG: hypothetical protein AABX13_00890 [Nanoarchaeota archaeon]